MTHFTGHRPAGTAANVTNTVRSSVVGVIKLRQPPRFVGAGVDSRKKRRHRLRAVMALDDGTTGTAVQRSSKTNGCYLRQSSSQRHRRGPIGLLVR